MKKRKASWFAPATVAIFVTLLAGCADANPQQSSSPEPSASVTTPVVEPMSPAEAKLAYKEVAKASCDAAQSLGVVESAETYTLVAVNKDENYKDFSAAYFEKPDKYALVWELDGLHSCADWYSFSMAEEAGQEAPIDVTFDETDATFTTFQDFGEYGTANYKIQVADGKILTATNLDPKNEIVVTIRYGQITDADRKILVTAVDQYLEGLDG